MNRLLTDARPGALIMLSGVIVAIGRFFIPGHGLSWPGTYEALAHLWVGFMIAVITFQPKERWFAVLVLAHVTALETALFFMK